MSTTDKPCLFVTDLHGRHERYERLVEQIRNIVPSIVFLGGDLLPHSLHSSGFLSDHLIPLFTELMGEMRNCYPKIFVILGNDDPRCFEPSLQNSETQGLWTYLHNRRLEFGENSIFGYACVPPTPFRLKDWERYDESRFCDPGSISPEEGFRTVEVNEAETKWGTIEKDLLQLAGTGPMDNSVFLFHSPPYNTSLDRAALDGRSVDHVPLDVHVGSVAIRRFIEAKQPLLTLHGHVHESTHLTGEWKIQIGRTVCINGAHDGPELAIVKFDLAEPENASRTLV